MRLFLLMLCYVLVIAQDARVRQARNLEDTSAIASLLRERNITVPVTRVASTAIELFWVLWKT